MRRPRLMLGYVCIELLEVTGREREEAVVGVSGDCK